MTTALAQFVVDKYCGGDHAEHREAIADTILTLAEDAWVQSKAFEFSFEAFANIMADRLVSSRRIAELLWIAIRAGV